VVGADDAVEAGALRLLCLLQKVVGLEALVRERDPVVGRAVGPLPEDVEDGHAVTGTAR